MNRNGLFPIFGLCMYQSQTRYRDFYCSLVNHLLKTITQNLVHLHGSTDNFAGKFPVFIFFNHIVKCLNFDSRRFREYADTICVICLIQVNLL